MSVTVGSLLMALLVVFCNVCLILNGGLKWLIVGLSIRWSSSVTKPFMTAPLILCGRLLMDDLVD